MGKQSAATGSEDWSGLPDGVLKPSTKPITSQGSKERARMSDVGLAERVEETMCMTYGPSYPEGREEGRISREDWEELKRTLRLALWTSDLTPVVRRAIQETLGEPVTPSKADFHPQGQEEQMMKTLTQIASEIKDLKSGPTSSDEYHSGYQDGRNDAWLIVQEASDNAPEIDPISIIKGFLAWSDEPDPASKSVRQQQLSEIWAKARALVATCP